MKVRGQLKIDYGIVLLEEILPIFFFMVAIDHILPLSILYKRDDKILSRFNCYRSIILLTSKGHYSGKGERSKTL